MNRSRAWLLALLSLVVGLLIGAAVAFWLRSPVEVQGSSFLASLAPKEISLQAGALKWQAVDDRVRRHGRSTLVDDLVLDERRAWAVTRIIAARVTIPPQDQVAFGKKLRAGILQVLAKHGERSGAAGENSGGGLTLVDGKRINRHDFSSHDGYLIGDTPGVVHIYLIGEEDSVTLFISLVEGR
jgi:hypothetical protein